VRLELAQVIVDLLPGEPDAGGERRGGGRLVQLGEQFPAHRIQRHHGGGRIRDHLNVLHATRKPLTNKFVNPAAAVRTARHNSTHRPDPPARPFGISPGQVAPDTALDSI
jgi:hypothetical protein